MTEADDHQTTVRGAHRTRVVVGLVVAAFVAGVTALLAFPIVRTQTSLTFVPASEAPWLTDGFPVPEGVAYRVPAYVVAGDFASGPYQRAYGVDWSGGELSFEIDGSNAQMFLSDASGRLLYFQRSEPGGRLVTLPLPAGLYVVVVEPERPTLPAAGFRLSVGAPH